MQSMTISPTKNVFFRKYKLPSVEDAGIYSRMTETSTTNRSEAVTRLIESADLVFRNSGAIPISVAEVACSAGVSRALVYAHFPNGEDLINAILDDAVDYFSTANVISIAGAVNFEKVTLELLDVYFEFLQKHSNLVHMVNIDSFMAGKLSRNYRMLRDGVLKRVARLARTEKSLPLNVSLSLVVLLASLADESARQVRAGSSVEMTHATMRAIATSMIEGISKYD